MYVLMTPETGWYAWEVDVSNETDHVTRGKMDVFLIRTFVLPLQWLLQSGFHDLLGGLPTVEDEPP